jgi:hypothetical protein
MRELTVSEIMQVVGGTTNNECAPKSCEPIVRVCLGVKICGVKASAAVTL